MTALSEKHLDESRPLAERTVPPYLEYVREVGGKADLDRYFLLIVAKALDLDAFITSPLPKKLRADDVNGVTRQPEFTINKEIGVREVRGQQRVIAANRRTEQRRGLRSLINTRISERYRVSLK